MLICFDGDRTLWDLNYDYKDCYMDLKAWMYDDLGMYIPDEIIELTLKAHLKYENKKDVYHRSVFPLCIMRTFNSLYLSEKLSTPSIELLAKAFRIGDRIYDNAPTLKDYSLKVIDIVEKAFPTSPLLLLTAGDTVIQGNKIYTTGLSNSFFETHITQRKDVEFYEDIYNRFYSAIDDDKRFTVHKEYECIMIGDSVKHDINPALEAGWIAIYISTERGDDEKPMECDRLYRAKDLIDAVTQLLLIRNDINDYKSRSMS